MNTIIAMGRLTRDPEVKYGVDNKAVAHYSIAVNRKIKREDEPEADFFNLVSFNKQAEFVEKYLRKGTKIVVEGELRNNNYTNKDGQKVYGMQIITRSIDFAESKGGQTGGNAVPNAPQSDGDGFMSIPDDIGDELPFN